MSLNILVPDAFADLLGRERPHERLSFAWPLKRKPDPDAEVAEYVCYRNFKRGTIIRIRRPSDLADLQFTVVGYRATKGVRNSRFKSDLSRWPSIEERYLRVDFAPQHMSETIIDHSGTTEADRFAAAALRASARSWIVFKIPTGVDWSKPLRLSALTDWSGLKLLVDERAGAAVSRGLTGQLEAAFGKEVAKQLDRLPLAEAREVLESRLHAPSGRVTSLELSSRLLLSPSENARWTRTARPKTFSDRAVPLFSVSLEGEGRRSLRALWSRWFSSGRVPYAHARETDPPPAPPPHAERIPEKRWSGYDDMLSLRPVDHWGIVGQTSVHGLPALRGRRDNAPDASSGKVEAPRLSVVRPSEPLRYIEHTDDIYGGARKGTGIALTKPFDDVSLDLSALGAVFDAAWSGDPAGLRFRQYDNLGYNLERVTYRSWLGRDSRVVAVDKGFLFPLGIRVSRVTTHERRIYTDAAGRSVSRLVRRIFIVTSSRPKTYPGPYHPYDARNFPARSVTMRTRSTPDLVMPSRSIAGWSDEDGCPPAPNDVFWVKVPSDVGGAAEDFQFEWTTEDAPSVLSPMIFVVNSVAKKQKRILAGLTRLYNHKKESPRRRAMFGGARQRYAESSQQDQRGSGLGETSYDTVAWTLKATGRDPDDLSPSSFEFDGRMEGEDQPPFYPALEEAEIELQTVEQVAGGKLPPTQIRLHKEYLKTGFHRQDLEIDEANPQEIFAEVIGTRPIFSTKGVSHRSGGIATTDTTIAGLSRRLGIVPRPTGQSPLDRGQFADGSMPMTGFSPSDFFGNAKLLGVVRLSDVVIGIDSDKMPAVKQFVEYGTRQGAALIKPLIEKLLEILYSGSTPIAHSTKKAIDGLNADLQRRNLSFALLYPELHRALLPFLTKQNGSAAEMRGVLEKLRVLISSNPSSSDIVSKIAFVGRHFGELIDQIDAFAADPVPALVDDALGEIDDIIEPIRSGTIFGLILGSIENELREWLRNTFCRAVDESGYGRLLFGSLGAGGCEAAFEDPIRALRALGEGIFAGAFRWGLGEVNDLLEKASGIYLDRDWGIDHAAASLRSSVNGAIAEIERDLAPFDEAIEQDLRHPAFQRALEGSFRTAITAALAVPSEPPQSLSKATEWLLSARDRIIVVVGNWIAEETERLRRAIRPTDPVDRERLLGVAIRLLEAEVHQGMNELGERLEREAAVLDELGEAFLKDRFQTVTENLEKVASYQEHLANVATIARAVRGAPNLCKKIDTAVVALAADLTGPPDTLRQHLGALQAAVDALAVPPGAPPHIGEHIRTLKSLFASAALSFQAWIDAWSKNVERLHGSDPLCQAPRDRVVAIETLLSSRWNLLQRLNSLSFPLQRLEKLISGNGGSAAGQPNLLAPFAELHRSCLGMAKVLDHDETRKAIDALAAAGIDQTYTNYLQAALEGATRASRALEEAISQADTVVDLERWISGPASQYLEAIDQEIVSVFLSAAGFVDEIIGDVSDASRLLLVRLCDVLLEIYTAVRSVYGKILAAVSSPNSQVEQAIAFMLQGLTDGLNADVAELDREIEALRSAASQSPEELLGHIRKASLEDSPLRSAAVTISTLLMSDIGAYFSDFIKAQLESIAAAARELIADLAPTNLVTTYSLKTKLTSRGLFIAGPPGANVSHTRTDLEIDSRFRFDMTDGNLTVTTEATLGKFGIELLRGTKFLSLYFQGASFKSENGDITSFNIDVEKVVFGDVLEMLQDLQNWLKPRENGPYVTIADDFSSVEAGYNFSTGLIQVGSLQFINVAFKVAAELPFGIDRDEQKAAVFSIALGSATSPFLIASPPYGGGGFLILKASAENFIEANFSFEFGGVAALEYGPLRAQARAVVGFYASLGSGGPGFEGFFAAVGEGNIGCFSISVSLRISVRSANGRVSGETQLKFTFKVGFIKVRYRVSATYGDDRRAALARERRRFSARRAGLRTSNVPTKETDWSTYRKAFALIG